MIWLHRHIGCIRSFPARTPTKTTIIAPIRQFPFCRISVRFRSRLVSDMTKPHSIFSFRGNLRSAHLSSLSSSHMSCGAGVVACLPNGTSHPPTLGLCPSPAPHTPFCVTPQLEYFNYLREKCRHGYATTLIYMHVQRPTCGNLLQRRGGI